MGGTPPIRGLNHLETFCRLERWILPNTAGSEPVGRPDGAGGVATGADSLYVP